MNIPHHVQFIGAMIREEDVSTNLKCTFIPLDLLKEVPITGDLKEWLDNAERVIYISLGSIARLNSTQLQKLADGVNAIGKKKKVTVFSAQDLLVYSGNNRFSFFLSTSQSLLATTGCGTIR